MTPPPTSFTFQKALSSPNILAPQSIITASSSMHVGLENHCSYGISFSIWTSTTHIEAWVWCAWGQEISENALKCACCWKVGKERRMLPVCQTYPSWSWIKCRAYLPRYLLEQCHTWNNEFLVIIHNRCPFLSFLWWRVWRKERYIWFLLCAIF